MRLRNAARFATRRRRRISRFSAVGLAVALLATGVGNPAPTLGAQTVLLFQPTDDTYAFVTKPSTNFGAATALQVKSGAKERRSFLRFAPTGIDGTVTRVELRLRVTDAGPAGGEVYAAAASWTEGSLSWNNQPAINGSRLAAIGGVTSGSTLVINLGAGAVTGDGPVAFRISAVNTNLIVYASGETATPPLLAVTVDDGAPPTDPPPPPPGDGPVIVGAGDIANCGLTTDTATAALLDGIAGTVFTAGDNAYPDGSATNFTDCYEPTWGRHRARTRPAPGNHEYHTPGATGYYGYFGPIAGDPLQGWYSFDLGAWHVVSLNSNCTAVGGCGAGSPQEAWLRADLVAHPATCTLAYWHHPLFSSGRHGGDGSVRPLWQALYDADADLVISGHDHDYERFAPQAPTGVADSARGIREFVVGTGGTGLRAFAVVVPNSEARNSTDHGVLKLTLNASSYDWAFIPIAGLTYADSGSGACH